ncbi:MAG: hypothetical protein QW534_05255 [Candidatus Methanomethylicia archaeon]
MSVGRQLLEELRRDEDLRKALSDELIPEVFKRRDLRKAILIAISREIATKEDIEALRKATKEDIEALRETTRMNMERIEGRVSGLEQRVARLEGQLSLFIKLFIAFNVPILVGIMLMMFQLWRIALSIS